MRTILISLTILAVLISGAAIFLFDRDTINVWEIRVYILLAFLLFMIMAFANLRLYNSAVINSRYLGKLSMVINNKLIPALNKLGLHVDKAEKATSKTDKLNRSIEELNKILSRKKSDDTTT